MRVYRALGFGILSILFLVSCTTTGTQDAGTPATASGETRVTDSERQRILEQQRTLAEERARQQEEAARQQAEAEEAARRAEEERLAREESDRRAEEEAARREAERQRELAARRAAEQARIVAAQQARIEELRAQISDNEEETANIEAANSVLRQAVAAAERLNDALSAEEQKYENTDPDTGQPVEALEKESLEELAAEVETLSDQAESLLAQP